MQKDQKYINYAVSDGILPLVSMRIAFIPRSPV